MKNIISVHKVGRILTLVGSIMDSAFGIIISVTSLGLFGVFLAVPLVTLSWISRDKALKGSQGFMIYGLIYGILLNWISAAGYAILLVTKIISLLQDDGWTITISKNNL